MANYTPTFTKPYPNGWVDKPSKTTPATAAIMNSYDTAIAALEAYLRDNAIDTVTVSVEQFPSDGRQWLGTITVGSNQYRIYMPSLKYENSVSDGVKIGTITLGEQSFDVYAPASSAGGSTVSVVPKTLTGTNIAEITVDGTTYQLYAPTGGGGSGSTVTAEATLKEGAQIGKITIDGVETILYAPTASPITVDSELSATSENAVQNKVVTTELNKKIETLGDESQAPDAVNFDLDSELSLTSVKGVQNKVIAEEFQKYANGTKVVAKSTEADTATKATKDAQGNVIETTYAKKTEIPQGSVVDDSLSSTSVNPVQNKVVKAEFDNVNSNLSELKVSDVAGGKNLLNKNKFVPNITISKDGSIIKDDVYNLIYVPIKANIDYVFSRLTDSSGSAGVVWGISNLFPSEGGTSSYNPLYSKNNKFNVKSNTDGYFLIRDRFDMHEDGTGSNWQLEEGTEATDYEPYIPSVAMLAEENAQQSTDLSNLKDGTTPVAKAVADEDGNNIRSTYAKKTETSETVTEDVNVVLNSDLFDSTYSDIACVRIGKLCVLSFTIRAKNTISSTIDKIVLMSIVGKKYQPKKISAGGRRQIFQGFAVGNYDENGKQSQSLNNTVRIITDWASNYTEIITRDKDRLNWSGYVQGQIMWVTD